MGDRTELLRQSFHFLFKEDCEGGISILSLKIVVQKVISQKVNSQVVLRDLNLSGATLSYQLLKVTT